MANDFRLYEQCPQPQPNISDSLTAVNYSMVYKNDSSTGKLSSGMKGTTLKDSKVSCNKIKYNEIKKKCCELL
jgi:uncharacterized protein YwbE